MPDQIALRRSRSRDFLIDNYVRIPPPQPRTPARGTPITHTRSSQVQFLSSNGFRENGRLLRDVIIDMLLVRHPTHIEGVSPI